MDPTGQDRLRLIDCDDGDKVVFPGATKRDLIWVLLVGAKRCLHELIEPLRATSCPSERLSVSVQVVLLCCRIGELPETGNNQSPSCAANVGGGGGGGAPEMRADSAICKMQPLREMPASI